MIQGYEIYNIFRCQCNHNVCVDTVHVRVWHPRLDPWTAMKTKTNRKMQHVYDDKVLKNVVFWSRRKSFTISIDIITNACPNSAMCSCIMCHYVELRETGNHANIVVRINIWNHIIVYIQSMPIQTKLYCLDINCARYQDHLVYHTPTLLKIKTAYLNSMMPSDA